MNQLDSTAALDAFISKRVAAEKQLQLRRSPLNSTTSEVLAPFLNRKSSTPTSFNTKFRPLSVHNPAFSPEFACSPNLPPIPAPRKSKSPKNARGSNENSSSTSSFSELDKANRKQSQSSGSQAKLTLYQPNASFGAQKAVNSAGEGSRAKEYHTHLVARPIDSTCLQLQPQPDIQSPSEPCRPVYVWTNQECCAWLAAVTLSFPIYHDTFIRHDIDGRTLLKLTEDKLENTFGIANTAHRYKIMNEICKLRLRTQHEEFKSYESKAMYQLSASPF